MFMFLLKNVAYKELRLQVHFLGANELIGFLQHQDQHNLCNHNLYTGIIIFPHITVTS